MKADIRIPGPIYDEMVTDLERSHPFAAERVGFLSVALGRMSREHLLLLVNGYRQVLDEDYIDDPFAGARIGSGAIREALQRILDTGSGQFHVHMHGHRGLPGPSRMDARETPPLVRSMAVVDGSCAHGAIILSRDRAWAQIWAPGAETPILANTITVVGFPFRFLKR